jgi:ligand-binding sensor domain-containing protein
MAEPKVIIVDESKLKKIPVGNPKVVPTNTNIHLAGKPKIVNAGTPRVCTPGQDTFLIPKTVPAIDSSFAAGIPEVVIAKDAYVNEENPEGLSSFSKLQGLKRSVIACMLQDKSGNLWFGTNGGGVSKYDGKSFTHFTEKEGLSNNTVSSILEDKSGNLWFGTYGGGVSKYDGKSFTHFTEKEGLSNNTVWSILEDKSGNLWFGTDGGVSKYGGKSFTHFTEKEGLSNNTVFSILEDKSGNLWFGTYGGGVSKLALSEVEGSTQYTFTHFTEKEGLSNNVVWSMLQDKSGNLWFGTDGGVSKLAQSEVEGSSQYTFTHFTEKEGFSNNVVASMLEDKSGNLWFGTRFGLSKLSPTNREKLVFFSDPDSYRDKSAPEAEGKVFFKNYTYEDGFLGIGCNARAILEAKDGTIWIGANDRLTAYHPPAVGEIADTLAPNIQLTSIALFNENIAWVNLTSSVSQGRAPSSKEKGSGNNFFVKDTTIILGNGVNVGGFEFNGLTRWYNLPENLSLAYNNNYITFNFIGITQNQPKKVK